MFIFPFSKPHIKESGKPSDFINVYALRYLGSKELFSGLIDGGGWGKFLST